MRLYRSSGLAVAVVLAIFAVVTGVAAAGDTLRIDPPTSTVGKDATFTVKVVQNASVATSGAQASITFDKTKLQVATITRGTPFAAAALFLGADAAAIASANKSGNLKTVAAAFLPPGSVPAGDQEFITVGFKAIGCGVVKLGLPAGAAGASLLDGRSAKYGATLKATSTGATVTIDCGVAASSAPPVGPSASPQGSVLGETFDPGASTSPDPLATTPVAASSSPIAAATDLGGVSPSPSPAALAGSSADPTGGDGSEWLTFGLAALGVAAIGGALLILLMVIALIVAAAIGAVFLVRYWRRSRAS